jgi:rod shape determining protein RodA
MYQKNPAIGKGFDWVLIGLYALLVLIGLLCIFSVEYRTTDGVIESFLGFKKNLRSAPKSINFVSFFAKNAEA